MPRLVGKRSNKGLAFSLLVVLVAIAGLGALEYKGYTNLIPAIGEQRQPLIGESEAL